MTDHDLKKMNRKELLELLIALEKENDELKAQLQQKTEQLESRDIQIENAGNLAEASLVLNGVFESAEKAVEQYKENIKRCNDQQASMYEKIVSEAEQKAEMILNNAHLESQQKIQAADEYWKNLSVKLEAFYQEHVGLRELLSVQSQFMDK